ncbi:putative bifunctional diguanylate cyclase/phosphodiesterase [Lichenifustis flavocetrariae]|uniref:EAL domain-containing protein n=1 Tax=Lichenifustis flavocetrariae TaxID=2949735 RepID=A0AA41Z590_9HYPH|nr:EAL domain-containing protein [Lichenifustis flavocetrariae]MCW6513035.1 EAL domain-containing protein [Lichenifustis flavocetrariae]
MRQPLWSIRMVLIMLGTLSVAVVVGLASFGLFGIERQLEARRNVVRLEQILINHNNADNFMDDVRADVLRALKTADGTNREGGDKILAEVKHHIDTVKTAISENLAGAPSADLRESYSRIAGLAEAFAPSGQHAVELALEDPIAGSANYERFRQTFTALESAMDDQREVLQKKLLGVRNDAALTAVRVENLIVAYSIIGVLLLALMTAVSVKIAQRITTELASSKEEANRLALHDTLTGLPNRAFLASHLAKALTQAEEQDSMVAVLCLDLDRFKQVNDTLGHPIGDALLRAVADRIRTCLRENDIAARLGGDEFAIVQSPLGRVEEAGTLAQRVVDTLSKPYVILGHQIMIGASVGIALAPIDTNDAGELLKMADIALYRAKSDGRGLFRVFERGMDTKLQARRALELDLRAAIELQQFELHYQPLVDVVSGRVSGLEALIRWKHPERGMIGPDEFIPLAEETGLIVPLGAWVLHQACTDAVAWPGDVKIAVNVSPAQFKGPELVTAVLDALTLSGLHPARLELEITETALLSDASGTVAVLHELRAKGVRIAMDDFGTGYSSLGYLRSFPFDKIKIDRCFVREIETSADCKAIVRAVTSLGVSLGISTTAEGVETSAQLEHVRAEGCDQVQGYLFSRPVPARDVLVLLGHCIPSAVHETASTLAA